MRFCPFCSAENADELAVCQSCGRRLPPLPPRKGRNAPPTGIQLPNRPAAPPPVPSGATPATGAPPMVPSAPTPASGGPPPARRGGATMPPPIPPSAAPAVDPMAVAPTPAAGSSVPRESAPALPPPPVPDGRDELLNALNPGPAATRRQAAPEDRIIGDRRGRNDSKAPALSPTAFARPGTASQPPPMTTPRAGSPSQPPPVRPHSPSQPPPIPRAGSQPYTAPPASGPHVSPSSTQVFAGAPPTPPAGAPIAGLRSDTAPTEAPRHDTAPGVRPETSSPFSLPPPPAQFDGGDFYTKPSAEPIHIMEQRLRGAGTGDTPPPTRINRADATDRPFTPPKVQPVPEIPEPGLVNAARYTYQFAIAWWQRRGAIRELGVEIKQDTEALDQVLGALGRAARGARIEGKVFSVENAGISAAEERVAQLQKENGEVEGRKAEENSRFVDIERERNEKLADAERQVEEGQKELTQLEAQRRSLRDKRKELERRQKAYLKSAEDQDRQAGSAPMGDQRQELRRSAEGHRREAAALEPDRQEIDRRLGSLERPFSEATAKLDAAKAELDAAKRSLNDAREGHTHRLAELDAEQKRKSREVALAEGEIARRLVTLGTLVNLNRIEDPQFTELYQRIDRLRGAITARTTEIEKLTAEREAKDNGTFWRGVATIGAAFMLLILLIAILRAIL